MVYLCHSKQNPSTLDQTTSWVNFLTQASSMSTPIEKDDGLELAFKGIRMSGKPTNTRWDLCCKNGRVDSISQHMPLASEDEDSRFLIPSLCHPHIHLDKCFLLSHPKYADLEIQKGDFAEAMTLTSKSSILYTWVNSILFYQRGSKISV